MIRPHSGPYPHVAGCAGCRVRQLCDVCGAPVVLRAGSRQQLAACVALLSRCLAHAGALGVALLLAGCAFTTPMVHPTGDPVLSCGAWGWGWLGFPLAMSMHQACVAERERQGFIAGETKVRVTGPK